MPKIEDKDPELVAKFITYEDLDKFWKLTKENTRTNELLCNKRYLKHYFNNDLVHIISFLEKYCKNEIKRHNLVMKILEFRIKSNKLLFPENNGFVWANPDVDTNHIKYTLLVNEQIFFLQKISYGFKEYISNNYQNIDNDMKIELYCLFLLLQEIYSNISIQSYEKIQEINSVYKGFKYYSRTDIDIDIQIKYVEDKLKEIGIYDEFMSYINKKYGKFDNIAKKKIPN